MRVKQENVQRSLYLSDDLIDRDRVSVNEPPVNVSPPAVHKHRILCVDDDVLGTNMRAEILEENGYSVVAFHSPLEATRCDLSTFNLAILDFEMPGLNGRESFRVFERWAPDSQSCYSLGSWRIFRKKIASCLRGVSTRARPFITYSTRSRNFWSQTRAPIMARDGETFRRTEPRKGFKPAARVVGSEREKRRGFSISDARNSIGISKAMQ